jgi:4-carboxymuconolactone decarboxylase
VARIRLLTSRELLPPAAQAVFDDIEGTRGVTRGPFAVLLHRPEIAAGAQRIGAFLRYASVLPADLREATILIVAATTGCEFEWDAHYELARSSGLGEDTIEAIARQAFDELDGDLRIVADVAVSLIRTQSLDEGLFERARLVWTEDEIVEIVALVGYYIFLATVLNSFGVGVEPNGTAIESNGAPVESNGAGGEPVARADG